VIPLRKIKRIAVQHFGGLSSEAKGCEFTFRYPIFEVTDPDRLFSDALLRAQSLGLDEIATFVFLEHEITHLLISDTDVVIELASKSLGSTLYLSCLEFNAVTRKDSNFGLMNSFLNLFSGLRVLPPQCSGNFMGKGDPIYFSDLVSVSPDVEDWKHAVIFYHAQNGDSLVAKSDDELAWYSLGMGLRTLDFSIAHVFHQFLSCRANGEQFDSFWQ